MSLQQDARFGVRILVRRPGFTAAAVLVLALGIGANVAMFSLVNALVLKPLPGQPAGALVGLFSRDRTKPDAYRSFSYPNYADLRERRDVFASIAAHTFSLAGLVEGEGQRTRRVFIDIATANFFETFGARLALGRTFTPDEERPGSDMPVAILSYSSWQRLGGDSSVLSRTIRLSGRTFSIVGVAPKAFGGSMAIVTPELWVPTGMYDSLAIDFDRGSLDTKLADRRHHNLFLVAQLQPGATPATIEPALESIAAGQAAAHPAENHDQTLVAAPLSRLSVSTNPENALPTAFLTTALLSMSGVVLLIASLNLANMLLARGAARRKEFALRAALGGGRLHLVRQLLVESLILAVAGGMGGLVLSTWATRGLTAALASFSPVAISFDVWPDVRILGATIGFAGLATIFFGLGPALRLARTDILAALQEVTADVGSGRRRLRLQHGLVMGQLALSLVMLTVAGMFMRGAVAAVRLDPGFTFERGVMVHADAALGGLDDVRSRATYVRVLDALRARPDVAAVGAASIVPFGDITISDRVQLPGAQLPVGDPGQVDAIFTVIGSGYFDALGLPILAGRDFTANEERADSGERVAIIDAILAKQLFGDASPLDRLVQYGGRSDNRPPVVARVVGVVPGTRHDVFDVGPVAHIYPALGADFRRDLFLHIRTAVPSADAEVALLPSIRRTIEEVDRALPVLSVETRAMYREGNFAFALIRLGSAIFIVFGVAALVLAAAGVYGVKAYIVSRRTREIGIRVALGATPGGVVRTVMAEGLAVSLAGLSVGLLLAVAASNGMRALTFQGRGADLLTIGGAVIVLLAAAGAAAWIPARRAANIAPTIALRAE